MRGALASAAAIALVSANSVAAGELWEKSVLDTIHPSEDAFSAEPPSLGFIAPKCPPENVEYCRWYIFRCSRGPTPTITFEHRQIGFGYLAFVNTLRYGSELPYLAYEDYAKRSVDGSSVPFDEDRAATEVNFTFERAERIGDRSDGSFSIKWQTRSDDDTQRLLSMLSSGEPILVTWTELSVPQRYWRLDPIDVQSGRNLAREFAQSCDTGELQ